MDRMEDALLSPAVEVLSKSKERTKSERPSSSSSWSGRQQGKQPQESFHRKKVEKRVAATATRTREPRTMRNMNGAVWVNGLEGVSDDAADEGEALALEVDEGELLELELEDETVGADEATRTAGSVEVGEAFESDDESGVGTGLVSVAA